METATLSRERPSSTSSTTPLKDANGPSDTRTCSPTSKETDGLGRSMPSCTWCRMRCFGLRDRLRLVIGPEKSRHFRGVLDEVVGLVGKVHLHQHVAGEELPFGVDLLAATHLDDLFGRHHDLVEQVIEMPLLGLLANRIGNLAFEVRIGLDDVPMLIGHSPGSFNRRRRE